MDYFNLVNGGIVILLGATIGSFLNVCIYRLPRDISINKPKRSFCTSCNKQIPIYLNIPILSWIMLGGKCKFCKSSFSFRYCFIEIISALFFFLIWKYFGFPKSFPYFMMISLFIIAFFIDVDFMIIPDSITLGGVVAGFFFSAIVPSIHDKILWHSGLFESLKGAAAGFLIVYLVLIFGKLAFGKKKILFDNYEKWNIQEKKFDDGVCPVFSISSECLAWYDIFYRRGDTLILNSKFLKIDDKVIFDFRKSGNEEFKKIFITEKNLKVNEKNWNLEECDKIEGSSRKVIIPREAMGFGDVKFMAMIGAFLGYKSVIFSLIAGSFYGVFAAILGLIFKKEVAKIPFGPHLALGAVTWLFFGEKLLKYYFGFLI